jgi:hypothetical protein
METLGGPVPKEAERKSLASLQKIVQERFNQDKQRRAEFAELQAQAQAPLWALIQKDEKAAASVQKLHDLPVLIPPPPKCPAAPPWVMESSYQAGSITVVRTPPYDTGFADAFGSADSWSDTPEPGICGFKIGQGAHDRAMNGVGIWFWSTTANPLTRFSAFLTYCFNWSDHSVFSPAYNSASVNLWVWGDQENAWVVEQNGLYPSWNDSTGGIAYHSDSRVGSGSVHTYFPAAAYRWYLGWFWISGATDYYSGKWGFSNAQAFFNTNVSFVTFAQ